VEVEYGTDTLKFVIQEEAAPKTRITASFGVGRRRDPTPCRDMLDEGLAGVEFCVLNTDVQALAASPVPNQLAMGSKITHGLGAGSDPSGGTPGRARGLPSASSTCWRAQTWSSSPLAWAGGNTAPEPRPWWLRSPTELGALTVAVVTKPFGFEGPKRRKQAEDGLAELAGVVDTVITIPTINCSAWFPKAPAFSNPFASPTTSCARRSRASATSSPRPA